MQDTPITKMQLAVILTAAGTSVANIYFIGGSLGTFVRIQCWDTGGWPVVPG